MLFLLSRGAVSDVTSSSYNADVASRCSLSSSMSCDADNESV